MQSFFQTAKGKFIHFLRVDKLCFALSNAKLIEKITETNFFFARKQEIFFRSILLVKKILLSGTNFEQGCRQLVYQSLGKLRKNLEQT